MTSWLEKLRTGSVVLLDGGTGSELRRRHAPWGDATWSGLAGDARPDLLVDVHSDYIRSGAEIVTANTFGTVRFVLESAGSADRFEAINGAAVAAARSARVRSGIDVAVAGSMSCLPPSFDPRAYPAPAVEAAAYRELAELLARSGVDLLALEMLQDTRHATRACAAARASGLPFMIGVSCRVEAPGARLVAFDYPATTLPAILDALLEFEPIAVNVMHSPVDAVAAAIAAIRERWSGPIGVYPEIDSSEVPGRAVGPAEFAALGLQWVDLGAQLVGGCCGTGPDHIAALRDALAARRPH
jgi:homocysteine S-methyltransferase